MGEKKNRQFSREFKLGAVERMQGGSRRRCCSASWG